MDRIGRYRIIGELGRGAMGVVYHATDPSIGRSVAIKTIRIKDASDKQSHEKLRERLFREARSAGVLSHPNIVTIYDMEEVDGIAYIAMAFVNGPTLEKILASKTPLSGANMLQILRQTASALDYAHERGIVHRDVKPANIMTDEDGAVKITDFGIAKFTAMNSITETLAVVGTPNYMSPEQVQGVAVDGRSDQFSLAVIAYEILTGERPFPGENLSTVVYKIVAEQPADAHRINATLTPQIDAVLRRALAKKPEERYPNCSSFVGALEMACAESRGWQTLTSGGAAAMPTVAVEQPVISQPPISQLPVSQHPQFAGRNFGATSAQGESTEMRGGAQRQSLVAPFLMSVFVVLGVASVIIWQAGGIPGLISFRSHPADSKKDSGQNPAAQVGHNDTKPETLNPPAPDPDASQPGPAQPTQPQASGPQSGPQASGPQSPGPQPSEPQQAGPPQSEPAPAAVQKPSPLALPAEAPREVVRLPSPRIQDVWVATNPPGAKVILDDNLDLPCQTPCMLHGATGLHHLTISQAGYLNEYREIHIGETAQDIPLITLRKPGGTLMLTTNPPGASVHVNGQLVQQVTPAQITLPPGSYSIVVEKGGKSQTQKVDIHDSPIYLRIPLDQ